MHVMHVTTYNQGEFVQQGSVLVRFDIVEMSRAKNNPVGKGRTEPNHSPYLPPPTGRISWSLNPFKMIVNSSFRFNFYVYRINLLGLNGEESSISAAARYAALLFALPWHLSYLVILSQMRQLVYSDLLDMLFIKFKNKSFILYVLIFKYIYTCSTIK